MVEFTASGGEKLVAKDWCVSRNLCGKIGQTKLSPDLPCRIHDPIELPPHFIFAHHLGIDAAEAALGTECELPEGQVARGLIDTALEFVERFKVGTLGRDKTQDDNLILGNQSQGLKTAGSLAVVFEQQPVMFEGIE